MEHRRTFAEENRTVEEFHILLAGSADALQVEATLVRSEDAVLRRDVGLTAAGNGVLAATDELAKDGAVLSGAAATPRRRRQTHSRTGAGSAGPTLRQRPPAEPSTAASWRRTTD